MGREGNGGGVGGSGGSSPQDLQSEGRKCLQLGNFNQLKFLPYKKKKIFNQTFGLHAM